MMSDVLATTGDIRLRAAHDVPTQFRPPAPPRHFVGRARELEQVRPNGVTVLSGPGGVGKTALALKWLHDRRSDDQLYVDLGVYDTDEALAELLEALNVPHVPAADRAAVFQSLARKRPLTLLLDNAHSADQVTPLLPGSGTVVVTSRASLDLPGAREVEVAPLTDDESVELLETLAGQRKDEVARWCGGLPLSIVLMGARLSTKHETLPPPDEPASVETVLDLSYVELPARQARLYRLCAWHPGTHFDLPEAVAIAGESECDVEDALDDLVEKSLLTEVGDDGFRFHDLVRAHARAKRHNG